jgi:hypothetical protein
MTKCCDRCGLVIIGPVHVVDVSRLTHRGPELEVYRLCGDCCDAVRAFLTTRPEVACLEPVGAENN